MKHRIVHLVRAAPPMCGACQTPRATVPTRLTVRSGTQDTELRVAGRPHGDHRCLAFACGVPLYVRPGPSYHPRLHQEMPGMEVELPRHTGLCPSASFVSEDLPMSCTGWNQRRLLHSCHPTEDTCPRGPSQPTPPSGVDGRRETMRPKIPVVEGKCLALFLVHCHMFSTCFWGPSAPLPTGALTGLRCRLYPGRSLCRAT